MSEIIKWVTFEWSENTQLFDQLVVSSIDNAKFQDTYKDYKTSLYYTETPILWPNDQHGSFDPGMWLSETGELEKAPELERRFGNLKGIYQKEYKGKISVTGTFYDWMRTTKTIKGANSDIQAKVLDMGKNMSYIMNNGSKTKAQVLVQVLTKWHLGTAANWPGSLTPDGQPLFSASHPIASLWTTQSNIQTWVFTTDADRITALTAAVNKLRNMRLANGDFVYTTAWESEPYVLKVSVPEALAWKRALNGNMKYSGQWANANAVNIFEVADFMVRIEACPMLWTYDADKNIIGDLTSAYLMNPVYLREAEALKCYTIKDLTVVTDEIKDPRSYVAIWEAKFGADHYGAELWIVKLTGQA
jgi:hypothetical protein